MKRFFRWLKALFNRTMDNLEDPDIMLDQARRDMQEALVQNREKAVQAITQKNRLQQMKAQWKQAQIQTSISKALEGLTFESEYEGSFAAAKEKIQDKQAEAAARSEMMAGSLQGKLMQMEDQAMDYAAEAELKKLEEKLGLATPGEVALKEPAAKVDDIEAELEKLEDRLNNQ